MRWPPDSEKAGLAPRLDDGLAEITGGRFYISSAASHQEPVFTASPNGRHWQIKIVAADGDVARLGNFHDRLTALGSALLMSARVGGRAIV